MALIHKMSVKSRKISIANRNFVQGGINSDVFQIELDQEFTDCERVLVSMKRDDSADDPIVFELPENKRINIPSELMSEVGTFTVGVIGYDADGNARVTTEAIGADKACSVVEASFIVDSENPPSEEQQDIFQQLGEFVKDAQASLDKFDDASMSIGTVETLEPGTQATANFTGEGLQKVLNLGIPQGLKGDKGDKGDPGEQGIQGIPGVDGQDGQDGAPGADGFSPTVEVSKDGSVTTISITDKTGPKTAQINDGLQGPPGEKGDPGADGTNGQNGADGFSPTVEVSKSGTVTTISITDKTGVKTAEISDGAKGDKGEKGDPGDKGDPGTAATIAVGSVTGLDAGASPTVVNSGTANAAIFDFGIPKGDKGDTGDPGQTPQRGVDYWTAEDVEAIVEDAKAQAVAELAEIGNVPKRTVSDRVAHGEDAYSGPREVRIKGKTWKNLWPKSSSSSNGITMSCDDTGLFTLSGTSTSVVWFGTNIPMTPNTNLKLSSTLPSTTAINVTVEFYNEAGDFLGKGDKTTVQIVTPEGTTKCKCVISIPSDTTVDTSFRVMLVEGTEVPDCFTPTGVHSVKPEKIVMTGKNLIEFDASNDRDGIDDVTTPIHAWDILVAASSGFRNTSEIVSVSVGSNEFALNDNGASGYGPAIAIPIPADVTFTLSGDISKNNGLFTYGYWIDGDDRAYRSDAQSNGQKITGKMPAGYSGILAIFRGNGDATDITFSNIQLELGSTATAYESPQITEVELPETDPLMYIYDRGDELVIKADGTATVERQIYHELFDGSGSYPNPIEADGYQYVALNSTKDKPMNVNINMSAVISDRFVTGQKAPGNVILTTGSVSGDGRNYIAFLFCFEPGTFADMAEARQWFTDNPTNVWFVGMPETEQLGTVTLPQLPAPTFNVYPTGGDVPGETSVDYERDVNIAFKNLEEIVNGLIGD